MPKTISLRMDDERAATLELVARTDDQSLNAAVLAAIDRHIDARRNDSEFREQLRKLHETESALFERLSR